MIDITILIVVIWLFVALAGYCWYRYDTARRRAELMRRFLDGANIPKRSKMQ